VPLHFSAFHPDFKLRDLPPTPPATLARARRQALAAGLRYVYTGNVHDLEGDATRCPGCGATLIARDWYELLDYRLAPGGRCLACGEPIPGRFDPAPGHFGRQRLPVRLGG
jgi:pyruvate formate lyase activating enzyme